MTKKYQALLKIMIIVFFVMILFKFCLIFLWPFFVSLLLTFLLEPMVKFFIRKGISRKLSVIISFFFTTAFIFIIGVYISKYMYDQILNFFQNFSSIITILSSKFDFLNNQKDYYTHLINTLEGVLISYRSKILETIITTFNGVIYIILIFMTTVFISMDFDKFIKITKEYLSEDVFKLVRNICIKTSKVIRVEIQLVLLTTLQTVIGLCLLGVKNALTIGIICGILDLLPILGPALVFFPWIIYEFLIKDIFTGVGLIFVYILLQLVRELMKIKFVGQSFQIHPVVTIISLYVGVILYGLWGFILGPVIVIVGMELFNVNLGRRRLKKV